MAKEEVIINIKANSNEANRSLEKVKQNTAEIKNEAKDAASEFSVMGVSLNGVKSAFTKITGASKLMFGSIKAGLLSTGIGAFVLAIGSLATFFTKTKKGAEKLDVAFAGIGATVNVLIDRFASFGEGISLLFKGEFTEAFETLKGALSGITDEIKAETNAFMALEKAEQRLEDRTRALNVETARQRAEVEQLKFIAEDVTKSSEERLEAAEKAFEIENSLLEKRISAAQQDLHITRERNAMSEAMAEDLDLEAEKEIKLFEIKNESITKQIELNNKINAIKAEARAKEIAENQKVADDKKKLDDEELARTQLAHDAKAQAAQAAFGMLRTVAGEQHLLGQAAAVAQATMNTYQGATKAIADYGFPLGAIFAAATVAQGLATVSQIKSTPEGFATGGVVGGSGSGTSDSVSARLSRGESVINANSTRMYRPLLSAINEAGGGRRFADGGIVEGDTGGMTAGVVKAYVVADDMSNAQDRLAKIRRKSTI